MDHQQTFLRLLPSLYAAAAEPELWQAFLRELLDLTHAHTGMVLAFDEDQRPVLATQLGVDDATQRSYREHFFETDIIRERIAAAAPLDTPWVCLRQELVDDRELERNSFYNEYMRPNKLHHQMGTTIGQTPGFSVGGLSILRAPQEGIFEREAVSLLELIAPHMRSAFLLDRKFRRLELQQRVLHEVERTEDTAFLAIDSRMRVVLQNEAADTILAQCPGLKLEGGVLRAVNAREDERLQRLIRGAFHVASGQSGAGLPGPASGSVSIARGMDRMPLQITVAPLFSGRAIAGGHALDEAALIFLALPDAPVRPRSAALRQIFGLSPSEGRLADHLLSGASLRESAELLGLTEGSARFMLKVIFKKTGVNSQSALMKLMLALKPHSF